MYTLTNSPKGSFDNVILKNNKRYVMLILMNIFLNIYRHFQNLNLKSL